jgi:hypothetical protein
MCVCFVGPATERDARRSGNDPFSWDAGRAPLLFMTAHGSGCFEVDNRPAVDILNMGGSVWKASHGVGGRGLKGGTFNGCLVEDLPAPSEDEAEVMIPASRGSQGRGDSCLGNPSRKLSICLCKDLALSPRPGTHLRFGALGWAVSCIPRVGDSPASAAFNPTALI